MERNEKDPLKNKRKDKIFDDVVFYSFIIDSLPVGIFTVNPEMKVTSFNPWAEKITGYAEKEVLGRYCGQILQGGMCKLNCPLKTAIDRQHPVVRLDTTIRTKYGQTIPVRMNTAALLDKSGTLMGAVEAFQDISRLKALERENDTELPVIRGDTTQLRRVFTNLLDNAIKFSKKKGTITLSTLETPEDIVVKVKDEGIGISPDELPYIFDTFHRGRNTENKEGFGLGLASVKAIVEGHGGRVLVESRLGEGSIFTVMLPKEGRHDKAKQMR
ncbi:MAG: ATP-binding protein [Deltaproteobacteria bacterium]